MAAWKNILLFETCDITLQTSLVCKAETSFSVSLHISDSYYSSTLFQRQLSDSLCFGNTPIFNIIFEFSYPEEVFTFSPERPHIFEMSSEKVSEKILLLTSINMCLYFFPQGNFKIMYKICCQNYLK